MEVERCFVLNRFAISPGNYVFDGPEPLMGDPFLLLEKNTDRDGVYIKAV